VEGVEPGASTRAGAALVVRARLDELRSLAGGALDPDAAAAQHEMRIAAKRLRYTLEIAGGCFGEEAVAGQRLAKELQGVLGDAHDCDVMLARVEGIESVVTLLHARRRVLLRAFRDLWLAEETAGVWAELDQRLR
jgi:CHAD domain-containing protein